MTLQTAKSLKFRIVKIIILEALIMMTYLPVSAHASSPNQHHDASWANRLQVYEFIPYPLEWNRIFHVSVHGLWAGLWSANSPLPASIYDWLYGHKFNSTTDYVSWIHENGMLATACIAAVSVLLPNMSDIIKSYPELETAVCREINGEIALCPFGGNGYWMCGNNPLWTNWLVEQGKRCIDSGVDILLIDELVGNTVMLAPEPKCPGFCDLCISGFRDYLRSKFTVGELREKFGINDIEDFNYREYLLQSGKTSMSSVERTPLWGEFMRFQEKTNFESKKKIIEELRSYIKKKGRSTLIAGNPSGFDIMGFRYIHLASLCDMLTFETRYAVPPNQYVYPPRGKWLAIYKQAKAIVKGPVVTLPDVGWEGYQSSGAQPGKIFENYICLLFAEAYASQAALAVFKIGKSFQEVTLEKLANYASFVTEHKDLYEDSIIQSSVAVVDLYTTFPPSPRGLDVYDREASYLGLAQALAEPCIPFNVEFAGDDHYIPNNLTAEQLKKYKIILIPSAMNITESQRRIVETYVMKGGIAVVPANHEFNTSKEEGIHNYGEGEFIVTEIDSTGRGLGLQYWYTYNDQVREQIASLVKSNLEEPTLTANLDRTVVLFQYYQPEKERMIIHLVNYDYNVTDDSVKPKEDIQIRVKKPPSWWNEGFEVFLVSPDFGERIALQYLVSGDYINLTIPKLDIYDAVVIQPKSSEPDVTP